VIKVPRIVTYELGLVRPPNISKTISLPVPPNLLKIPNLESLMRVIEFFSSISNSVISGRHDILLLRECDWNLLEFTPNISPVLFLLAKKGDKYSIQLGYESARMKSVSDDEDFEMVLAVNGTSFCHLGNGITVVHQLEDGDRICMFWGREAPNGDDFKSGDLEAVCGRELFSPISLYGNGTKKDLSSMGSFL
jgi:hypothetical protein